MNSRSRVFALTLIIAGLLSLATYGAAARSLSSGARPRPAAAAGPAADPVAAASSMPGADPAIQRWFLSIDKAKIAFDDALLRAERAVAASTSGGCSALDSTVKQIVAALPRMRALSSPAGAKIAAAVQPVMTTMGQAAASCLTGDFAAAQKSLNVGIGQQATAQASIDAILDGDQ